VNSESEKDAIAIVRSKGMCGCVFSGQICILELGHPPSNQRGQQFDCDRLAGYGKDLILHQNLQLRATLADAEKAMVAIVDLAEKASDCELVGPVSDLPDAVIVRVHMELITQLRYLAQQARNWTRRG
jgi:hypothetical protein